MKEQFAEFDRGKEFLASMMGKKCMTQKEIDVCITIFLLFLQHCNLYILKAFYRFIDSKKCIRKPLSTYYQVVCLFLNPDQ